MNDLRSLLVHRCLQVHNLIVEPSRVRATYTLVRKDGSEESNELIYSYKHPLFDPESAEDINLASMMLAQVALNYGLFFERIEFDGLFDETDRRFLLDMMENTSREIAVNKFYSPNEFLVPPYDDLPMDHPKRFTAATVEFVKGTYRGIRLRTVPKKTNEHAYAILSSGGKDSLLTYGLIRELGEAHPVYINESGRHWYTAVNAFKYMSESEPNVAKPWCNSDRIFSWMARQMPFIRENFQNIRADNYPIRLWTVAVFLFGVLPIARKRGIGNILIGNEYDTTLKGNFHGVTHYLGLYDQSRYFDNALSRYYSKKGWDIQQYSVLRCLSELLILKILVKRYPVLQSQQVSCHAAHEKDGRMYPCGKCEKCRRIVGMLTALGENPQRCGYTPEQVSDGLQALASRNIKQLGSDASHLYYMLLQKGAIAGNPYTMRKARKHPEIVSLRFDRQRSTLEDLPHHLRKPLLKILSEYSEGAVNLVNRKWHTFALEAALDNSPAE